MASKKTPTVFIVSDGRGETALQLVKAAAVQFESTRYRTVKRGNVRTPQRVRSVVEHARDARGVIFYTLVSEEVRSEMRRSARELEVPSVDVLGPAFTALGDLFHRQRGEKPGLLYMLDRERNDRMDAIDYTLKHDDGQRPHELSSADVVLVGVSRASKSTTCFYLASEGIRAANVPLVPNVAPPRQLLALPRGRVIGLRIELDRLLAVREGRARNMGLRALDVYLDRRTVSREIIAANRLMDEHGWPTVNASYLAVEEITREVLRLVRASR